MVPRWASLPRHLINTGWVRFSFRLCVLFCLMKPVATPLRATLGEAHRQGTEDSVPLPASKELNPATGPVGQVSRACFPGGASRWTSVPQHRLPGSGSFASSNNHRTRAPSSLPAAPAPVGPEPSRRPPAAPSGRPTLSALFPSPRRSYCLPTFHVLLSPGLGAGCWLCLGCFPRSGGGARCSPPQVACLTSPSRHLPFLHAGTHRVRPRPPCPLSPPPPPPVLWGPRGCLCAPVPPHRCNCSFWILSSRCSIKD